MVATLSSVNAPLDSEARGQVRRRRYSSHVEAFSNNVDELVERRRRRRGARRSVRERLLWVVGAAAVAVLIAHFTHTHAVHVQHGAPNLAGDQSTLSRRTVSDGSADEAVDDGTVNDYNCGRGIRYVWHLPAQDRCGFVTQCYDREMDGHVDYVGFVFCTMPEGASGLGLTLLILLILIEFWMLGVVADDFFADVMTKLAYLLRMSEEIAGVTLLAFGNGASDLSSAVVALAGGDANSRVQRAAIAFGGLYGAAIFLVCVIPAAIAYTYVYTVDRMHYIRDCTFLLIAVVMTYAFVLDGTLKTGEAIGTLAVYAVYIAVVVYFYKREQKLREGMDSTALLSRRASCVDDTQTTSTSSRMAGRSGAGAGECAFGEPDRVIGSGAGGGEVRTLLGVNDYDADDAASSRSKRWLMAKRVGLFIFIGPWKVISTICRFCFRVTLVDTSTLMFSDDNWWYTICAYVLGPLVALFAFGLSPLGPEAYVFGGLGVALIGSIFYHVGKADNGNKGEAVDDDGMNTTSSGTAVTSGSMQLGAAGKDRQTPLQMVLGRDGGSNDSSDDGDDDDDDDESVAMRAFIALPVVSQSCILLGAFVTCLAWFYVIAAEMIDGLTVFGDLVGIPASIMGLTFLAWGNCVVDFLADYSLSRAGQARMAVSATIAGLYSICVLAQGLLCLWAASRMAARTPLKLIASFRRPSLFW